MFFINLIMLLFILATLAFILSITLKQKEPFSLQLNREDAYKSYQESPSTFLNTLLSDYHDVYKKEIVPRGGIVNFHKQSLNNH